MSKILFNTFSSLPFIEYNIVAYLTQDPNAENIFKLLYYPNYDALSKPNLTTDEKLSLIWKGEENTYQNDYNIFLTPQVEDMQTDAKTYMKIYKIASVPLNNLKAVVAYEFDVLFGGKIAMVEYEGYPCNRANVFEMELMKSLNGSYINGILGQFQFNTKLSRLCESRTNIGNNTNYTGVSFILAGTMGSINDKGC